MSGTRQHGLPFKPEDLKKAKAISKRLGMKDDEIKKLLRLMKMNCVPAAAPKKSTRSSTTSWRSARN
jgi:hypothetical protein